MIMCTGVEGDWDKNVRLMELAYNNSFHASVGTTSFEALYGRPWSPLCLNEVRVREIENLLVLQHYDDQVKMIHKQLLVA